MSSLDSFGLHAPSLAVIGGSAGDLVLLALFVSLEDLPSPGSDILGPRSVHQQSSVRNR